MYFQASIMQPARLEVVKCWPAMYSGGTCSAMMGAGQSISQCMLLVRALLQTCRQLAEQAKHDQSMQDCNRGAALLRCPDAALDKGHQWYQYATATY